MRLYLAGLSLLLATPAFSEGPAACAPFNAAFMKTATFGGLLGKEIKTVPAGWRKINRSCGPGDCTYLIAPGVTASLLDNAVLRIENSRPFGQVGLSLHQILALGIDRTRFKQQEYRANWVMVHGAKTILATALCGKNMTNIEFELAPNGQVGKLIVFETL